LPDSQNGCHPKKTHNKKCKCSMCPATSTRCWHLFILLHVG
jgi:hypothetical protein